MKNISENFPQKFERIQVLTRKLIPFCWPAILLIILSLVFSFIQIHDSASDSGYSLEMLITSLGVGILLNFGLLLLIIRFFYSCGHDGLFSKNTVSSIRWIGWFIFIPAAIKFLGVVAAGAMTILGSYDSTGLLASGLLWGNPLTKIILGVFFIILAKIMALGGGLEKEAELTI